VPLVTSTVATCLNVDIICHINNDHSLSNIKFLDFSRLSIVSSSVVTQYPEVVTSCFSNGGEQHVSPCAAPCESL